MKKFSRKEAIQAALKEKKWVVTVYLVLRFLVLATLVLRILNRDYESAAICVLTLILFTMPSFVERRLHIDLPDALEIVIFLFIFAAEILGEIQEFYVLVPHWDTVLHTINGFLFAAIGFCMVNLLNSNPNTAMNLSPFYVAVAAFCFSMTIGVLWEFFECAMDQLFLLDMQKDAVVNSISSVMLDPTGGNTPVAIKGITDVIVVANGEQISLGLGGYLDIGILDTMKDLVVNFVGAVVFSFIGYFYVKSRGKGRFAKRFIPQVLGGGEKETAGQSGQEKTQAPKE